VKQSSNLKNITKNIVHQDVEIQTMLEDGVPETKNNANAVNLYCQNQKLADSVLGE